MVEFGVGVEEVGGEASLSLEGVEWVVVDGLWVVEELEVLLGPGVVRVGVGEDVEVASGEVVVSVDYGDFGESPGEASAFLSVGY